MEEHYRSEWEKQMAEVEAQKEKEMAEMDVAWKAKLAEAQAQKEKEMAEVEAYHNTT